MASQNSDELFWYAYCDAIQRLAGDVGPDGAIFFPNKAQKAPIASSNIPSEFTNFGIHGISDNALASNDLFYDPSAQRSFVRSLRE